MNTRPTGQSKSRDDTCDELPTWQPAEPFHSRRVQFLDLVRHRGWSLKRYAIVYGHDPFDHTRFESNLELALSALPRLEESSRSPGLGMIIAHQGRGVDYYVLAWWDNDNELPIRVWVRRRERGAQWRPASGSESICVWDLQIIWFERQKYVAYVLGDTSKVEEYLDATIEIESAS